MNAQNRVKETREIVEKRKVKDFLRKMKFFLDLVINLKYCDVRYLLYLALGLILSVIIWRGIALISRRLCNSQAISKSAGNSPENSDSLESHMKENIIDQADQKSNNNDLTLARNRKNKKGRNCVFFR